MQAFRGFPPKRLSWQEGLSEHELRVRKYAAFSVKYTSFSESSSTRASPNQITVKFVVGPERTSFPDRHFADTSRRTGTGGAPAAPAVPSSRQCPCDTGTQCVSGKCRCETDTQCGVNEKMKCMATLTVFAAFSSSAPFAPCSLPSSLLYPSPLTPHLTSPSPSSSSDSCLQDTHIRRM